MESLILAVSVVLPLFLWMATGVVARRALKISDAWVQATNHLVFHVFMPVLLFNNMLSSNLRADLNRTTLLLIVYCMAGLCITFLLAMKLVPRLVAYVPARGVMVQSIFRSNVALYGIPVTLALYGEGETGVVSIMMAILVPMFSVFGVVCLEAFRAQQVPWRQILLRIVTNPLIIALALGVVVNLLGFQFPAVVQKAISGMAGITTPLAFFTLGAGFSLHAAGQNRKKLATAVLMKLVASPLVWVSIAVMLGFRGVYLAGVLIMFATPTSVSSHSMTCAMGGDSKLSGEVVVFTSFFSIVTIFLWLLVLSSLGLL